MSEEKPDVILLDVMMPGMSGFEVSSVCLIHTQKGFVEEVWGIQGQMLGEKPDAMLLDVMMPGMSGFEVRSVCLSTRRLDLLPGVVRHRGSYSDDEEARRPSLHRCAAHCDSATPPRSFPSSWPAPRASFPHSFTLISTPLPHFQVCRTLRQRHPTSFVPIIMVSAKSQEENIVEGLASGSNDYVSKPFGRQEILMRIKVWLKCGGGAEVWGLVGEMEGVGGGLASGSNVCVSKSCLAGMRGWLGRGAGRKAADNVTKPSSAHYLANGHTVSPFPHTR